MNLKAHARAERADLAALLAAWPEAHRGSATGTVRVSREPSGSYLYGRPRFRGSEGGGELACTPDSGQRLARASRWGRFRGPGLSMVGAVSRVLSSIWGSIWGSTRAG
jgi:hypothetical protein